MKKYDRGNKSTAGTGDPECIFMFAALHAVIYTIPRPQHQHKGWWLVLCKCDAAEAWSWSHSAGQWTLLFINYGSLPPS